MPLFSFHLHIYIFKILFYQIIVFFVCNTVTDNREYFDAYFCILLSLNIQVSSSWIRQYNSELLLFLLFSKWKYNCQNFSSSSATSPEGTASLRTPPYQWCAARASSHMASRPADSIGFFHRSIGFPIVCRIWLLKSGSWHVHFSLCYINSLMKR